MKSRILAGLLASVLSASVLAQVVYPYFAPGGALSGTGTSQNVNLSAGSPFIVGTVPEANTALSVKPSVTVVATTNQTLSGTPTIDGVTTVAGTSIPLLTAQIVGAQNGPWVVQSGAWTRPSWYPSGGTTQAFQFITTLVRLGTTYQGSTWRMTTAGPLTIDTDATTWAVTPFALNANTLNSPLTVATVNATSASAPYQLNGTTVAYYVADPGGGFSMFFGQGAGANAGVAGAAKGFFTCVGYQTCGGAGAGNINNGANIENTAMGWGSGSNWTTATFDTAFGIAVMRAETTGSNNSAFGADAMNNTVGAASDVAMGVTALKNGAPQASVGVGNNALIGQASSTETNDVAVGSNAMGAAGLTTASQETALGAQAGAAKISGNYDLLAGFNAGGALTTGAHNVILAPTNLTPLCQTGSGNIIAGYEQDCLTAGTSNEINIGGLVFYNNASTAAPAVSACGTGPSIDTHANNRSGTVTVGTVAAASCTVTFAGSGYNTWNHCRVTSQSVIASFSYAYTKTAITVTGTSLVGDLFDYDCDGY